jgi:hypothetical protein
MRIMPSQSKLFKGDQRLEACLIHDSAHITPGTVGEHVGRIQTALATIDGSVIQASEISAMAYGPSTTTAVLAFKRKRQIINYSYETQVDNIVGKMTIAALDLEVLTREQPTAPYCVIYACPHHHFLMAKVSAPAAAPSSGVVHATDVQIMQRSYIESQWSLAFAGPLLDGLIVGITAHNLNSKDKAVFKAVVRWLKVDPKDPIAAMPAITAARRLMLRACGMKTSARLDPPLARVPGATFITSSVVGNVDRGIDFGDDFFKRKGPRCRRDVVTHECFHMLGVHHGGQPLIGPDDPSKITTTTQALDDANSLAQLVAQLTTPHGRTGACERDHE